MALGTPIDLSIRCAICVNSALRMFCGVAIPATKSRNCAIGPCVGTLARSSSKARAALVFCAVSDPSSPGFWLM